MVIRFYRGRRFFSVAKTGTNILEFNVCQTLSEALVIKAIHNFLINLLGEFKILNSKKYLDFCD